MILNYIFLGVLVAISIPLWIKFAKSVRQGKPGLERRPRTPSPIGLVDVGILLLVTTAAELMIGGMAAELGPRTQVNADGIPQLNSSLIFFSSLGRLIGVLAGLFAITIRHGRGFAIFGWQPQYLPRDLLIGLASFAMVIPGILLVHQWLSSMIEYEHPSLEILNNSADSFTLLVIWFSAFLVAPIQEEIFYRGTLLSWLFRFPPQSNLEFSKIMAGGWIENPDGKSGKGVETDLGDSKETLQWAPIFITAAIFGAAHWGQGAAPISLFLLGVVLGYLYRQTGSITPCIVLHMLLNGMTLLFLTVEKTFAG